MSVKINASTSSGLVVDSDLTGSLKLQTGGNDALTVDSSQVVNFTKQFQIAGVLPPAFSAIPSGTQSITIGVTTKVLFQTETFDTNNNFASSRFTPTVAGYYQINTVVYAAGNNTTYARAFIYKNGTQYNAGGCSPNSGSYSITIGDVIYFNGSTDYIEVYTFHGANETLNSPSVSFFSGVLMRAA